MPDISWSMVGALITAIFSAGITWGIMTSRSKSSDQKIDSVTSDLRDIVKELRSIVTELQIMKAANIRNERDIEDHNTRIAALEIAVAKLQNQF